MKNKHKPTPEELQNDPSLRWSCYQQWELLWSDFHNDNVRFLRYEENTIAVATVNGIAELPDRVNILSIRRPSTMNKDEGRFVAAQVRTPEGRMWIGIDRKTGKRFTQKAE